MYHLDLCEKFPNVRKKMFCHDVKIENKNKIFFDQKSILYATGYKKSNKKDQNKTKQKCSQMFAIYFKLDHQRSMNDHGIVKDNFLLRISIFFFSFHIIPFFFPYHLHLIIIYIFDFYWRRLDLLFRGFYLILDGKFELQGEGQGRGFG